MCADQRSVRWWNWCSSQRNHRCAATALTIGVRRLRDPTEAPCFLSDTSPRAGVADARHRHPSWTRATRRHATLRTTNQHTANHRQQASERVCGRSFKHHRHTQSGIGGNAGHLQPGSMGNCRATLEPSGSGRAPDLARAHAAFAAQRKGQCAGARAEEPLKHRRPRPRRPRRRTRDAGPSNATAVQNGQSVPDHQAVQRQ